MKIVYNNFALYHYEITGENEDAAANYLENEIDKVSHLPRAWNTPDYYIADEIRDAVKKTREIFNVSVLTAI